MVPKAARKAIGRAEFTKSLGVTDRDSAKSLARLQISLWEQQVLGVLNTAPMHTGSTRIATDAELEAFAAGPYYEQQREFHRIFAQRSVQEGTRSLAEQRAELETMLARQNERAFLGDDGEGFGFAGHQLAELGLSVPDRAETRAWFKSLLQAALADAMAGVVADMDRRQFTPSSPVQEARERTAAKAKKGESIMDLFDRYATQRLAEKRKRQDTIDQDRKVVEQFAEFIGKDRSVRSISAVEVREWRDTVADLPPAFRKWKVNEGLTMREAATKARTIGLKGVTPTTINKYLSTISPFMKWCRQNSYIEHDPCNGLFYDLQKLKRRRPPFSVDQLNQIIASPLFVGFEKAGKEFKAGALKSDDWRYWIPLICMFTGARIGEVAQLGIADVKEQDGHHYLLIRHDEDAGQSTKSGHDRPAAIHPILRRLGFFEFLERQRERAKGKGNIQLFPELSPNERGQAGKCSRFWRTYLERIGVKDGADGFGAHSFRHTMADQLRLAGYLDDEIEVALGHNQISVTAGYGTVRQGTVARLAKMMADVEFEGLIYEHLIPKPSAMP